MPYRVCVPGGSFGLSFQPRASAEAGTRAPVPPPAVPPPAARSHPTPRAPGPLSGFGTRLGPPHSAGDTGSPHCTHPRGAARPGWPVCCSDRCGRSEEDARGSHACSAARPSVSRRASSVRSAGSAPHPYHPHSVRLPGPPAPPPAASRAARRRRPFPSPLAFILSLPFRDPRPCGPAQVGLRGTSPPTGSSPLDVPSARDTLPLSRTRTEF